MEDTVKTLCDVKVGDQLVVERAGTNMLYWPGKVCKVTPKMIWLDSKGKEKHSRYWGDRYGVCVGSVGHGRLRFPTAQEIAQRESDCSSSQSQSPRRSWCVLIQYATFRASPTTICPSTAIPSGLLEDCLIRN